MLRPARHDDAPAIAQIHVEAWHAALDVHVPALMRDAVAIGPYTEMWRSLLGPHAGSHTTLVATEDAGAVIGFATAGRQTASIPGFDCELHTLYVAPKFQRRNIGCRLFNELATRMRDEGCGSMAATVIDTPQARGFFRAMGGDLAGSRAIDAPLGAMAGEPAPEMDLFTWQPLMPQQPETKL